jgi:glycosyltransferase involved in cell wall biosynthesis
MGVSDPLRTIQPTAIASRRISLGITPNNGLIVGSFGIVEPTKRIESTLRAFRILKDEYPSSLFLLVGRFYDQAYESAIDRIAEQLDLTSCLFKYRDVDFRQFQELIALCDIVVNLRFPGRKNISAVLLRALAAGKPVIIHDIPEWSYIPKDCCLRILPGPDESSTLGDLLLNLARDPSHRVQIGAAARRWYFDNATIGVMVDDYRQALASFL